MILVAHLVYRRQRPTCTPGRFKMPAGGGDELGEPAVLRVRYLHHDLWRLTGPMLTGPDKRFPRGVISPARASAPPGGIVGAVVARRAAGRDSRRRSSLGGRRSGAFRPGGAVPSADFIRLAQNIAGAKSPP